MNNLDYKNLKMTLGRAALRRNFHTASVVGLAASGLILGTGGLAVSSFITLMYLVMKTSLNNKVN